MAVDPALAGGIGQGLMSAVQTFLQTQNMLQDQAIRKKLANAQTMDAAAKIYGLGGVTPYTQGLVQQYSQGNFDVQAAPNIVPYQSVLPFQQVSPQGQPQSMPSQQPGGGLLPASPPSQQTPSAPSPSQQSSPGQPQQQGLLNSQGDQASSQSPQSPFTYDPTMGMMVAGRPWISLTPQEQAAYAPALKAQAELMTPQGQIAYQKSKVDLANAQNEQFNKGQESFKTTKETFSVASDAYGKLMKVTDTNSPKNLQSALMQVIKLDMPRQAVRYTTMQAMEDDPQIMERWGNYISKVKSGIATDISINDLKSLGTNLYMANSDEFRSAQRDEIINARQRGVNNPSYVNVSYADKMDQLASKTKKNLPSYQAPTAGQIVERVAPPEVAGLINKAGAGLYAGAKGLLNSLNPSSDRETPSTAGIKGSPPPGLSFDQFKAWKRSNGNK